MISRSAGFYHASHVLEQETKHTNYQYGRDINFARDLAMKGRWEDLKKFLGPMKRSNFDYGRSMFLVDKQVRVEAPVIVSLSFANVTLSSLLLLSLPQIFLEMLDAQTSPVEFTANTLPPPSSEQIVVVLKELEGRCSQEEFHGLCFCLTVKSLGNHPEYKVRLVRSLCGLSKPPYSPSPALQPLAELDSFRRQIRAL